MGKVLFGDSAQAKLAADFYANDGQLMVNSTSCFPVIAENSGDCFYIYIVRPADNCSPGVLKEVIKVTATNGRVWQIERVLNQCVRAMIDFRMGDAVYYDPCIGQALADAFSAKDQLIIEVSTDYSAKPGDKIILRPVDNIISTFFLPANPYDKAKVTALKTRNGAGNSGYTVNPLGKTLNRLEGGLWDLPDYTWITFTYYANSNDWLVSIGD